MAAPGNDAELERLRGEADHLRVKLSIANNDHTKDHGKIQRLTSSLTLLEEQVAARLKALGPDSAQGLYDKARRAS